MAYTQTDCDNIKAAILALAQGTRKVRLTMGDKQIDYSNTDLNKLRILLAEAEADVMASSTTRKRYFMFQQTGKGL